MPRAIGLQNTKPPPMTNFSCIFTSINILLFRFEMIANDGHIVDITCIAKIARRPFICKLFILKLLFFGARHLIRYFFLILQRFINPTATHIKIWTAKSEYVLPRHLRDRCI